MLLTSVQTLFKHSKLGGNYSLKKLNDSISNTLNTKNFIKKITILNPCVPRTLVNISIFFISFFDYKDFPPLLSMNDCLTNLFIFSI